MIEYIHQQTGHGIRPICQVLGVPRSSYYHASQPTPCQSADIALGEVIEGIAVIIDLCSRRIVGWALADRLRAELVTDALKQALGSRTIASGLIFHSDRGSKYGSRAHRQMLEAADILQSMSARANPYHNAWTESFMGTLKNEMLQGGTFANEADARTRDLRLHRILLQPPPQTLSPRLPDPDPIRGQKPP